MMTMMYYIWGWQVEQCWLDWKCGVGGSRAAKMEEDEKVK
jgi:hypothetical protein